MALKICNCKMKKRLNKSEGSCRDLEDLQTFKAMLLALQRVLDTFIVNYTMHV